VKAVAGGGRVSGLEEDFNVMRSDPNEGPRERERREAAFRDNEELRTEIGLRSDGRPCSASRDVLESLINVPDGDLVMVLTIRSSSGKRPVKNLPAFRFGHVAQ